MQALQEKQAEDKRLREALEGPNRIIHLTIEDRIAHLKDLEYNKHAHIFACGYSSIHKAAADGSVAGIKWFLEKKGGKEKKIKPDEYDKASICPIHYAAEHGQFDVVEVLLESGCKVDVKTGDGKTALMYACKGNQVKIIDLLLANGARIWEVNNSGMSAFHFAAQGDHKQSIINLVDLFNKLKVEASLEDEAGEKADEAGAASSKAKGAKSTKDGSAADGDEKKKKKNKGAAVIPLSEYEMYTDLKLLEMTSKNGLTCLHIATMHCAAFVVAYLLEQGCNPNAIDHVGETPLHKAGRSQLFSIYRMLVKAGAAERLPNKARETPYDLLRDSTNS